MNLPNLPDNFYKLIIVFCLIGFYLIFSRFDKSSLDANQNIQKYNTKMAILQRGLDSIELETKLFEEEVQFIKALYSKDSNNVFIIRKYDSLNNVSKKNRRVFLKQNYNLKEIQKLNKLIDLKATEFISLKNRYWLLLTLLSILFIFSLTGFLLDFQYNRQLHRKQHSVYPNIHYEYCQNCAKRFSSSRKYGTNKDGSKNNAYCKKCLKKGKFKLFRTFSEFKNYREAELSKYKWWEFPKKHNLSIRFKNLDRWNKDEF